jgi:hypothetical protein
MSSNKINSTNLHKWQKCLQRNFAIIKSIITWKLLILIKFSLSYGLVQNCIPPINAVR